MIFASYRQSDAAVTEMMIRLCRLHKNRVHRITADNGMGLAFHDQISHALRTEVCFVYPYSLWERGLKENTSTLLR